jgi:hypothetical protein
MCTQYLHHIHLLTHFPHLLPPPTGTNPSPHCRTCSALLFSDFVKEKKMILLHREFPCDISMYICNITQICSSPLFFFFLT